MPIEVTLLADKPPPFKACPRCQAEPFVPFLRGQIQRSKFTFWEHLRAAFSNRRPTLRPYCVVICAKCKEIVGYESP